MNEMIIALLVFSILFIGWHIDRLRGRVKKLESLKTPNTSLGGTLIDAEHNVLLGSTKDCVIRDNVMWGKP